MERFFKVHIQGADSYGLSAIAPDVYRDRLGILRYCIIFESVDVMYW